MHTGAQMKLLLMQRAPGARVRKDESFLLDSKWREKCLNY